MTKTKLKNFRLGDFTMSQLTTCQDELGLTFQVQVIRVAIAHLHASREGLNVTQYLRELRRNDDKDDKDDKDVATRADASQTSPGREGQQGAEHRDAAHGGDTGSG